MMSARNPNPRPDSTTASARPGSVRGVTSPKPSVKNVVPLRYKSVSRSGFRSGAFMTVPMAQCSSPKPTISPKAHKLRSSSMEIGPK